MREHRKLIEDLAELIDLDAGLSEILTPTRHNALAEAVADVVDVETGLAAITEPVPPGLEDFRRQVAAVNPRRRLAARGHPAFAELCWWSTAVWTIKWFRRQVQFRDMEVVRRAIEGLAPLLRDARFRPLLMEAAKCADTDEWPDSVRHLTKAVVLAQKLWQSEADRILVALGLPEGSCPADRLHELLNDLSSADVSDVDLTGIPLEGIRWSRTTRWPIAWVDRIKEMSVEVAPGLFEIGKGTTRHDSFTW